MLGPQDETAKKSGKKKPSGLPEKNMAPYTAEVIRSQQASFVPKVGIANPRVLIPSGNGFLSEAGRACTRTLAEAMRNYHVPGISFARITKGKIQSIFCGSKVNENTLFCANSDSKLVTSVIFARLAQLKLINLDKSVNVLLKDAGLDFRLRLSSELDKDRPECDRTLRQILSHCAGISVGGLPGYPSGENPSIEALLKLPSKSKIDTKIKTIEVKYEPYSGNLQEIGSKTQFQYSGGGYVIAEYLLNEMLKNPLFQSRLAEIVDGYREGDVTTFAQLADVLVFQPLKMTKSTFRQTHDATIKLGGKDLKKAVGHNKQGKSIPLHVWPACSMAAMWTTASDYAKLLCAIHIALKGDSSSGFLTKEMAEKLIEGAGEHRGKNEIAGLSVW